MFPHLHFGSHVIGTYFLVMALALAVPLYYGPRRANALLPGSGREISNMLLAMFFSALVGFRLFHVFFEMPAYYLSNPLAVFEVWKGGFVAYGGLFFPIAVFFAWVLVRKLPLLTVADIVIAPITLVFVVARVACFLNGCCYGAPTDSWLGIGLAPDSAAPDCVPRHPTQLYLSLWAAVVFGLIMAVEKTRLKKFNFPGLSTALFLIVYPTGRFLVEFLRADFRGEYHLGLSVSQWLSLGLMGLGVWALVAGLSARSKKSLA